MRKAEHTLLFVIVFCLCVTLVFGFPWTRDMYDAPSIGPYEMPLLPPEGTLPIEGGALPMTRTDADETLQNPVPATAESIAEGRELYAIYCAACHGPEADGQGPVAAKLMIPPPDLTLPLVAQRSDGYLYGTIRAGGFVMPRFGPSMSTDESWAIVNYLRSLQGP